MAIVVDIDVMLARRKMAVGTLAERSMAALFPGACHGR